MELLLVLGGGAIIGRRCGGTRPEFVRLFCMNRWRGILSLIVMAGLVPAIHVFLHFQKEDVDARHKSRA